MTPWEFLDNLVSMDRGIDNDKAWMTQRMQDQWPGDYTVAKYPCNKIQGYWRYRMEFADPQEETMFRLKYL